MNRVYIVCEGPTEERFIKDLLAPYLMQHGVYVTPICVRGVSKLSIIKKRISDLCKMDRSAFVSMMFYYYAFPIKDLDCKYNEGDLLSTVMNYENAIKDSVGEDNFIPNLVIHEFEGLLFSDVNKFECCMNSKQISDAEAIRKEFATPEHINQGYDTAPSRRIKKLFPEYNKVIDGTRIAQRIGVEIICEECKHFGKWVDTLERLCSNQ